MFMSAITYFVTCRCIFLNSGSSQQSPVRLAKISFHKCILSLIKHLLVLYGEWRNIKYIYNPLINFRAILLAILGHVVPNRRVGIRTTAVKRLNRYFCFLLLGFHLPVREKWAKMYKSVSQHNYLSIFLKILSFFR